MTLLHSVIVVLFSTLLLIALEPRRPQRGNPQISPGRRRTSRVLGLLLLPLGVAMLLASSIHQGLLQQSAAAMCGFFVLGIAARLARNGRRVAFDEAPEEFVLYLRSHRYDEAPVDDSLLGDFHDAWGTYFGRLERRSLTALIGKQIEEAIAPLYALYCGAQPPPEGVRGKRIDGTRDWMREIEELAPKAKCILVHEGISDGIAREWRYLVDEIDSNRVLLVTGGGTRDWVGFRAAVLTACEGCKRPLRLPPNDPGPGAVLAFPQWDSPSLENGASGHPYAGIVRSALRAARIQAQANAKMDGRPQPTNEREVSTSSRTFRILDLLMTASLYYCCITITVLLEHVLGAGLPPEVVLYLLVTWAGYLTALPVAITALVTLPLATRVSWSTARLPLALRRWCAQVSIFLIPTVLLLFTGADDQVTLKWKIAWTLILLVWLPGHALIKGLLVVEYAHNLHIERASTQAAMRSLQVAMVAASWTFVIMAGCSTIAMTVVSLLAEGRLPPQAPLARGAYFAIAVAWTVASMTMLLRGGLAALRVLLLHRLRRA